MAIFKIIWDSLGNPYLFGGSKNVHIVWPMRSIIPDSPQLHYKILKTIQQDLLGKSDEYLRCMGDTTYLGEFVDGNHIVYTETPYMVYFNLDLKHVSLILPSQSSLPTNEQLTYIRTLDGSEGCVIVYKNTKTGAVYRHKHKTVWYILLRVIRESLCRMDKDKGVSFLHNRIIQRFKQRSQDFLNLSEDDMKKWSDLSGLFVEWLLKSSYETKDLSFSSPIGMARVWRSFQTGEILKAHEEEKKEKEEKKGETHS